MRSSDLRRAAVEVVRSVLARRGTGTRYRPLAVSVQSGNLHAVYRQPYVRVGIDLQETIGVARVTPDDPDRTRYPWRSLDTGYRVVLPQQDETAIFEAAIEAARRAGEEPVHAELIGADRSGRSLDAFVRLYRHAKENRAHVELVPNTGARLGYWVPLRVAPGRPAARQTILERALADEPPPDGAQLVAAEMRTYLGVKVWWIEHRKETEDGEVLARHIVVAGRRTGEVLGCMEVAQRGLPVDDLEEKNDVEERARDEVARVLGPTGQLIFLAPGGVSRKEQTYSAWIGTAISEDGLARVSVWQGGVDVKRFP